MNKRISVLYQWRFASLCFSLPLSLSLTLCIFIPFPSLSLYFYFSFTSLLSFFFSHSILSLCFPSSFPHFLIPNIPSFNFHFPLSFISSLNLPVFNLVLIKIHFPNTCYVSGLNIELFLTLPMQFLHQNKHKPSLQASLTWNGAFSLQRVVTG